MSIGQCLYNSFKSLKGKLRLNGIYLDKYILAEMKELLSGDSDETWTIRDKMLEGKGKFQKHNKSYDEMCISRIL